MPNRVTTACYWCGDRDRKAFGIGGAYLRHRRRKKGAGCVSVLTMDVTVCDRNGRVNLPVSGKGGIGDAK